MVTVETLAGKIALLGTMAQDGLETALDEPTLERCRQRITETMSYIEKLLEAGRRAQDEVEAGRSAPGSENAP